MRKSHGGDYKLKNKILYFVLKLDVCDIVFFQGAGSALMGRFGKFEQIVRGMNYVSM